MSILITGATGTVGKQLVRSLVQDYQVAADSIKIVSRDPEKAKRLFSNLTGSESIQYFACDISQLEESTSASDAFSGVERLFLVTSSSHDQKRVEAKVVKFAIQRSPGLKQVVKLSGLGSDLNHDQNSILRWNAEAERSVGNILEETDIAYAILRPNLFLQNYLADDSASISEMNMFLRPSTSKGGKVSHVDTRDIAEAAAVLLTQDVARNAGRTFNITGPEILSYEEIAEVISDVLGKTVTATFVDEVTYFHTLIENNVPESFAWSLIKMFQYGLLNSTTAHVYGDFQILTGKSPRSVKQFFQDHKELFQ